MMNAEGHAKALASEKRSLESEVRTLRAALAMLIDHAAVAADACELLVPNKLTTQWCQDDRDAHEAITNLRQAIKAAEEMRA